MLYLTGYLTQKKETEYQSELPEGTVALTIPNEEIRYIFEKTISKWFDESAKKWDREALFRYLMLYGVVTAKVLRER